MNSYDNKCSPNHDHDKNLSGSHNHDQIHGDCCCTEEKFKSDCNQEKNHEHNHLNCGDPKHNHTGCIHDHTHDHDQDHNNSRIHDHDHNHLNCGDLKHNHTGCIHDHTHDHDHINSNDQNRNHIGNSHIHSEDGAEPAVCSLQIHIDDIQTDNGDELQNTIRERILLLRDWAQERGFLIGHIKAYYSGPEYDLWFSCTGADVNVQKTVHPAKCEKSGKATATVETVEPVATVEPAATVETVATFETVATVETFETVEAVTPAAGITAIIYGPDEPELRTAMERLITQ